MNFEEFKTKILAQAKSVGACSSQYKRAFNSKTIEELIEVLKDNLSFAVDNNILTHELSKEYEKPELFNIGKDNVGFFNSGDQNSGYQNSGYQNSGYQNSGDRNSGDRNSGDQNSGVRNSGYQNSGYRNSGDRNSGYQNSGYRNSGDQNSGDLNSGDLNSGDLNSGYRNSGVFCNKKQEDTVVFFNKESLMTWKEWFNHPAYKASFNLEVTKWIIWDDMTDKEKEDHPKAFVCEGYVKVFDYYKAWSNLWSTLTPSQKESFKTLPNFDAEVFKDITGITI